MGRRARRIPTSGWSSSATACSACASRPSCTAASPTSPRGTWRGCAPTSSAAPPAPGGRQARPRQAAAPARRRRATRPATLAQLQTNQNVLADLTESLIGAVYLTFGYRGRAAGRDRGVRASTSSFAESSYVDHKTELQEYLARSGRSRSSTRSLGFSGPPHDREFEVEAVVDGEPLGRGFGTEQEARRAGGRGRGAARAAVQPATASRARRRARCAAARGSGRRRRRAPPEAAAADEAAGQRAAAGPRGRLRCTSRRSASRASSRSREQTELALRARRRRDHRPQRQRQEQPRRRRHLGARRAEPADACAAPPCRT